MTSSRPGVPEGPEIGRRLRAALEHAPRRRARGRPRRGAAARRSRHDARRRADRGADRARAREPRALHDARERQPLARVRRPAEEAALAREQLRGRLDLDALAYVHQVHGATVRDVIRATRGGHAARTCDADGQTSSSRAWACSRSPPTASPWRSPPRNVVAMLHAGWRGLAGGVLEEGVRALRGAGGLRARSSR